MEPEKMDAIGSFSLKVLEFSVMLFVFLLGVICLVIIYMYLADITQTGQTIRRNYPVLGRFRYVFEHMGEFFRQYFFAQDREELPLNQPGDVIFLNCLFPTLTEDAVPVSAVTFGEGYAEAPYTTDSLFNISGMSFGALGVEDKAERVASFARNMAYEVGIIAHSCGVKEPRELSREHAQLITAQGIPAPTIETFPNAITQAQYLIASDA